MKQWLSEILAWAARVGSNPNDDDDIRLQKSLLVLCAIPFMIAGFAWGLMYALFDEPLAGAIPFSYGVISLNWVKKRVLPMPGSPEITTTFVWSERVFRNSFQRRPCSCSLSIKGPFIIFSFA